MAPVSTPGTSALTLRPLQPYPLLDAANGLLEAVVRDREREPDVAFAAGAVGGAWRDDDVRLSLTVPDDRLQEAVRRIEERVRL